MKTGEIKKEILKRYSTLGEFAEEIGTSESQLSRWVKKPTPRFLGILEQHGIMGEGVGMVKDESEITDSAEVIKTLKELVYEKNKIISELKSIIDQKNDIIKQYEELNKILKDKIKL